MKIKQNLKSATGRASLLITGIIFLFFSSCNEDPTFLGRNLLPSSDDIYTKYFEGESVNSFVTEGKAINTSESSRLLIGNYYDDIFGKAKAEFMMKPEIFPETVAGPITVDSMLLSLYIVDFYGEDTTQAQTIRFYEFTDSLFNDSTIIDSSYYSDYSFEGKYNPIELGNFSVFPDDSSTVTYNVTSTVLKDRFESVPDSVYSSLSDFLSVMNGWYFTSDEVSGDGAVLYVDVNSSKTNFKVYYTSEASDTPDSLEMTLGRLKWNKINHFSHDFTGTRSGQNMNNEEANDSLMFVSAMAGVHTKITFPEIENWKNPDSIPVAINSAELYIPVDTTFGISEEDYPSNLILLTYDENNVYDLLYDYRIDQNGAYYGGKYDSEENAYVFNIGAQLQHYLNGSDAEMNMVVVAGSSGTSANRVVLKSPYGGDDRTKLKITYTRF